MNQTDLFPAAQRYFELMEESDKSLVLSVFAPDAIVLDDGHRYVGHQEIHRWLTGPASEFTTTSTWLSAEQTADTSSAKIRLAGDFPGSPVTLHYRLTMDTRGQIDSLAITA